MVSQALTFPGFGASAIYMVSAFINKVMPD